MKKQKCYLGLSVAVLLAGFANSAYTETIPEGEELPSFTKLEFKETDFKNSGYRFYPDTWEILDLNGTWKLKKLNGTENNPADDEGTTSGFWKKDFDDSTWLDQPVPLNWDCNWEKSEENGYPKEKYVLGGGNIASDFTGVGWYRKDVLIPQSFKNKRVRILFDAVDYEITLWVNGKEAGKHLGGRTPFEFDITDHVSVGEKNTLAMRVYDHTLKYGYGDNAYNRTGGVWQSVKIISSPNIYAKRILVTPRINEDKVEINCLMVNTTKTLKKMDIKALLKPLTKANGTMMDAGKYELKPGEEEIAFELKMKNPVCWNPGNPYLYSLLLQSGNTELGKARFGYRQFEVRGRYFYLNNKRKYLFGTQNQTPCRVPAIECFDEGKFLSRMILAMKQCGIEIVRNNNIQRTPKYYQLCDELGLMVYDEWECDHPSMNNVHPEVMNTEQYYKEIKEWIYAHYNNPSVVMLSFGNELYDGYAEKFKVGFHDILGNLYDYVKSFDKSGRPICNSSGRHTESVKGKDKTDILDIHNYTGTAVRSWTKYSAMLEEFAKEAEKAYGHDKPIIAWEFAGLYDHYHVRIAKEIREALDWSKKGDVREAYIKFSQEKGALWGAMRDGIAVSGFWKYYTTFKSLENVRAEHAKNVIEEFRRVGDIVQGMAPNDRGYIRVLKEGKHVPHYYNYMLGYLRPLSEREICTTPLFDVFQEVYRPRFVCADVFDKNQFAPGALKVQIYAINDLDEPQDGWSVKIRVVDTDAKVLAETDKNIGKIKGISRTIFDYSYDIPESLKTGRYCLELKLFEKDKEISWNKYNFYVMSRADFPEGIKTDKKAALYSGAEDFFNKDMNTKKILESLNINFSKITDFNDLKNYQILIIGAGAIDGKVVNSGETIRNWVSAGGRLLCFEQVWASYVPFLSEMKYFSGDTRSTVDIVQGDHPAFEGLTQDNFYDWNGTDKDLYKATLTPLNVSVLAAGGTAWGARHYDSIKPVIADVKLGKGEIFFSQVLSIQRYGKDCAATKYIRNILNYMLKDDISKYARTIEGEKIEKVSEEQCLFVDLSPYANRGFKDEIEGDEKGGWVDQGAAKDFRNFSVGRKEFLGVPFNIIDPEKNNDKSCIVLKGRERPYFPDQITDITVNAKVNYIYFLHTCAWTSGEQIHAEYVVNYSDGSKEIIPVKEGENISDWDFGADLPMAKVAWSGTAQNGQGVSAFLFKWHNPHPEKNVGSVDFVSKGIGVPVLLGITCLKRDVLED